MAVTADFSYFIYRLTTRIGGVVGCRLFYLYIILSLMAGKKDSHYEVLLSIVLFLLIFYFFSDNSTFVYIAFGVGLIALLSKRVTQIIHSGWIKLMTLVGFVNSHILLGAVFFLVLLPISLVYRLFHKDSINLKAGKKSYFHNRDHRYTAKDLDNPW